MKSLILIFLAVVLAPNVAFSCTNNFYGLGTTPDEPLISSDGSFAFYKEGVIIPSVQVIDAEGKTQPGTVTKLATQHLGWAPEVPLPLGDFTVLIKYYERRATGGTMRVAATPALAPPTLSDADILWAARAEWGCCQDRAAQEGTCAIYCGENMCNRCWTYGVKIVRLATAMIHGEVGSSLLGARVKGAEEITAAGAWNGEPQVSVELAPSNGKEACIEAVRIDGAGRITVGDTICVSIDDYPKPELAQIPGYEYTVDAITETPENCLGPPVDTEGQPDPTLPTGPGVVDDGCSTAGTTPSVTSFWLALLALLVLPGRRKLAGGA